MESTLAWSFAMASRSRVLRFLNGLGLIRRFRPLLTAVPAEKLARAPQVLTSGRHVIALEKIFGF